MDRFDAMLAFTRVVECASFTKAASTLHLSKTTVSQLVQQLEARLQVKLLNRTTRRVQVTEDGAAYYARAVRVLADLDDAESAVGQAARTPRGRLRVDVPSPLASGLLMPALADFYARYPEIELTLGASDRVVDIIGEHVDCVVRGGPVVDPSLIAKHIADLPVEIYAAPSFLAKAGTPVHPKALADELLSVGFLGAHTGKPLPLALSRGNEQITIQAKHALIVDDGNAYLAAGLAGLGLIWLPTYMAREAVAAGQLVQVLSDWHLAPMPLSLAYPPNRHLSAKLRVFIQWISALLAQHAPVHMPR